MIKPALSLALQLSALLLTGALMHMLAPSPETALPYLLLLAGMGLTYAVPAPLISKISVKTGDSFYLVFVGISGIRFLVFMSVVAMLLVFRPEIKNTGLTLGVTGWFLLAMCIEMSVFLTNLRPNSKKQS